MNPRERQSPSASVPPNPAGDRSPEHWGIELSSADAAAIEALLAQGLDAEACTHAHGERARRCAEILGLLGCVPASKLDEALIDATILRVVQARRLETEALAPVDDDALEALVEAGFNPERCPGGVRRRASEHAELLNALHVDVCPVKRETLVGSTLAMVQSRIDVEDQRRSLAEQPRWRPSMRVTDLVSVAALLLITGVVLTPMVGAMRGVAQATSCQAGMFGAMRGFAAYASDYRELLPMASESSAGRSWWNIGKREESNSANLFTMVRASYAKTSDLACPGNARACRSEDRAKADDWSNSDEISYSYQNLFATERPRWTQPTTVIVLADRSPVTVRAMRGEWFNPIANSDNHMQRGQNVLMNDGSVQWLTNPVVSRAGVNTPVGSPMGADNIWLPQALEEAIARFQSPTHARPLSGTESPAGATDVFLSP